MIVGDGVSVGTCVKDKSIEYVVEAKDSFEDMMLGQIRKIVINGGEVKCISDPFGLTGLVAQLDTARSNEVKDLIAAGDFVGAYISVLNELALAIEKQKRTSTDMEQVFNNDSLLTVINNLKHSLSDGRIVEEPEQVLRRLANGEVLLALW